MAKDPGGRVRPAEPAVEAGARGGPPRGRGPAGADRQAEGGQFKLEPWDWRYYSEKVTKAKYDLDEQALRPYFKLDNVQQGAFYVANRLYGITFTPRTDLPMYHPEVKALEVKDRDGSHLGGLLHRLPPAPGQARRRLDRRDRAAARCKDGKAIRPIVTNVCNFSRPAGDEPALLTLEEVGTLFHEFGHALSLAALEGPLQEPRAASRATSWRCRRRSWRTGRWSPRCSRCTRSTTRPAS